MNKYIFECYREYITRFVDYINTKKINIIKIKIIANNEKEAKEQVNKVKGDREKIKLLEIEVL